MIVYLRHLWGWTKLLMLFIAFTLIGYAAISALADWLKPSYRFEEPGGRAVKVFLHERPVQLMPEMNDWERFKLFMWTGE
ncbi:DUF4227 family protein [Numidum massiliense]|uniref:DUF4227 family protein n=1 Tax=Numidum massiliense TaxID=1522315 RepID=UPI0006D59906|nr:DUF4227 family protein [Numidum massiliense]